MKGIVVIPCFNRIGFLKICIDYIYEAEQAEQYYYIFCVDYGYDKRILDLIRKFKYTYAISERKYLVNGIGKQSANVLFGFKEALQYCEDKPIYYIEDDVFIGKDFFTFGEKIIKKEDVFCAILSKNHNCNDITLNNINAYYVKKSNEYQGIGTVYNSDLMRKFLLPHINHDYIYNPLYYVAKNFNSKFGNEFCEQDGLIRRIIEAEELSVAFSHVPRCFHAGFFGYHRSAFSFIQNMPINEQVKRIKEIAFNVEMLKDYVNDVHLIKDSEPVDLSIKHSFCKRIDL